MSSNVYTCVGQQQLELETWQSSHEGECNGERIDDVHSALDGPSVLNVVQVDPVLPSRDHRVAEGIARKGARTSRASNIILRVSILQSTPNTHFRTSSSFIRAHRAYQKPDVHRRSNSKRYLGP